MSGDLVEPLTAALNVTALALEVVPSVALWFSVRVTLNVEFAG